MPTSTPGVPQTNGVVERRVRIVKTGIRCLLAQAGLHKSWWPFACRATCIGHNTEVSPRKDDGVSPYYRRHGVHPKNPQIPFGVLVDYMPTPNPNNVPAPFDCKTRPGIFVGLHFQPGGLWSGDFIVADFAAFQEDPDIQPGSHACSISRTKEVVVPGKHEPIIFPLADFREKERVAVMHHAPGLFNADASIDAEPQIVDNRATAGNGAPIVTGDGIDHRGEGDVVGGQKIRKYKGSSRPPHIHSEVWAHVYSATDKRAAVRDYLKQIEKAPKPAVPALVSTGNGVMPIVESIDEEEYSRHNIEDDAEQSTPAPIVILYDDDDDPLLKEFEKFSRSDRFTLGSANLLTSKKSGLYEMVRTIGVFVIISITKAYPSREQRQLLKTVDSVVAESSPYAGTQLFASTTSSDLWGHPAAGTVVIKNKWEEIKRVGGSIRMLTNNPLVRLETSANNYSSSRAMALDLLLANFKNHKQVHEALCHWGKCPKQLGDGDTIPIRNVSAPAMPCVNPDSIDSNPEHREFNPLCAPSWPVMVARKVSKSEQASVPMARAAMEKEWTKLETAKWPAEHPKYGKGCGTWNLDTVQEASTARATSKASGVKAHFARIAPLCFQKHSELKDGDPLKVYKGRIVMLGDQIVDESFETAKFQELGSSPPAIEAARSVDASSCYECFDTL